MKHLSATEAARNFADVLDAVEVHAESFLVTRHGKPIARIEPAGTGNGAEVLALLRRLGPDPEFAEDLRQIRAEAVWQEREWPD